MLGASLIPARWRGFYSPNDPTRPGPYSKHVTPVLQSVTRRACTHPIHSIVFCALIASTTYIGLLETGLFEPSTKSNANQVDFSALSQGSRTLHVGPQTAWEWQPEGVSNSVKAEVGPKKSCSLFAAPANPGQHLSLVTLAFADSYADAPSVVIPNDSSAELLPSSASRLSLSQDSTLAYSLPSDETPAFLASIKEIAAQETAEDDDEQKRWIMRAARGSARRFSLREWIHNSWIAFTDSIRNAETLDIVIMALGYLSMHLTFASLFVSMRRMGSNAWLATSVLFSSAFALLFGLVVTMKLGVPVNVVLLSEGLPFLVVTVGFEKPIILTQAVLSAALNPPRRENGDQAPLTIQNAVQTAVHERGWGIVRDYMVEISLLIAGAMSGIQGGLRQFCFLAAWVLFFDCILLFTFYTAVLTIKLEVNRIKRHVALRKALEEDGVSRSVAESVASSNDGLKPDAVNGETSIFGRKIRDSSIPRFKVLMVSGFIIINVLNFCTIPFRTGAANNSPSLSSSMDPFKVAGNALDHLLAQAKSSNQPTVVTVFSPIKYELQYPSVHYSSERPEWSLFDGPYADGIFSSMGGRVVEGLLKSFEDPVLSKWIIIALAMSLVLNGYLFNAARWSIKEPDHADAASRDAAIASAPLPPVPEYDPKMNGHATEHEAANGHADGTIQKRSKEECEALLAEKKVSELNDEELTELSLRGKIPGYALEKTLGDKTRAVKIRRSLISRTPATKHVTSSLERSKLPYLSYDYDRVFGACCENVVGYMPLPLGVAGPITIDGRSYYLPMATTEGVLVASTSRGAKAINAGGGAVTVLTGDGMTRGPCVGFETLARAAEAKVWLDSEIGQKVMKDAFNSTSRFARLQHLKAALAGTYLYIRFKTTTGDAMGMNMISKGVEQALSVMKESGFEDMAIISVSGNYCTDKKPAAINWVDGRGKSVVAEAIIPGDVVRSVLKSDVDALVELNISKNLIGSAMAGSIGGFNAHAANIVTAIFLATGQDPAQNVESSNCITVMKK